MLKIELLHDSCRFKVVSAGKFRHPSSIQGLLIKKHYPGKVTHKGRHEPPFTWDHFYSVLDTNGVPIAQIIKAEFWVSHHRTALLNTMHLFLKY
jgi:hypothetical protein